MIKTKIRNFRLVKIINFGKGDIHGVGFENFKTKEKGIAFYNGEPGEVGRKSNRTDNQLRSDFLKKKKILMTFDNIESLDNMINNLEVLKKKYFKEETNATKNN